MPQVTKGGKFIFGWSRIGADGGITLPPQAVREYDIIREGKVILFTGSKSTGGFCVTRRGLWLTSKLGFVLENVPAVANCESTPCTWIRIKGRHYCWTQISESGEILLPRETLDFLQMKSGEQLLSIRSSDIAFTMGHHGQLVERARLFGGEVEVY
ncbi:MAG: hypothetical protein Q4D04_03795 [Clostridia bacterium]|nr:hypothetical protein [Clostridia bacterium]